MEKGKKEKSFHKGDRVSLTLPMVDERVIWENQLRAATKWKE